MKAVKAEDLAVGKIVYLTGGRKIRGTKGAASPNEKTVAAAPTAPPKSDAKSDAKSDKKDKGNG